jgi:hypothetical protein
MRMSSLVASSSVSSSGSSVCLSSCCAIWIAWKTLAMKSSESSHGVAASPPAAPWRSKVEVSVAEEPRLP